ncbi:hypothetical protein OEA41_004877 [Lepraria neglecta]|uniref:Uncharacterized protein n=1 Tax=Lepraria neglecta TaxID=209136 RepID=A0AAE0DG93_9LECA|nr:hypothetical protein OEA41_004877 [Lepraria neglecta]
MSSKRYASITYCNTLFRPAFCPFCLSDDRLPASSRWTSWTREAKLWSHLGTHLKASQWPMDYPHPSYSLQLQDETSFLYHLSDVHSLQMSPHMKISWQSGRDSQSLIHWVSDPTSQKRQKRKRQDNGEQELRLSKHSSRPVMTDGQPEWTPTHSLDPKDLGAFPISVSSKPFEVSLMDMTFDDDRLPELSPDQSTSSPDSNETCSLDGICPYDNISPTDLMEELGSKTGDAPTPDDEALFSQYLRSPSPYSHAEDDGGTINTHISLPPPTIPPK